MGRVASWVVRIVGSIVAVFGTIGFVLQLCGIQGTTTAIGVSVGIVVTATYLANLPWIALYQWLAEMMPGSGRAQDRVSYIAMPLTMLVVAPASIVAVLTTDIESALEHSSSGAMLFGIGVFVILVGVLIWFMSPVWDSESKKNAAEHPALIGPGVRLDPVRARRALASWSVYLNGRLVGRIDEVKYRTMSRPLYYPCLYAASTGEYDCGDSTIDRDEAIADLVQQVKWGRTKWPLPMRIQGRAVPYPPD